jgi:class 3 adenylate cyclase
VVGDGPVDVVFVPGSLSHLEHSWEEPGLGRFLRHLASFSRLIAFDPRGTGMSDPVPIDHLASFDDRVGDIAAVMDAAGSDRAALLGTSTGGAMALAYAARWPERVNAVATINAYARAAWAPDHQFGRPELSEAEIEAVVGGWGEGLLLQRIAPSMVDDERFCRWWRRYERLAMSRASIEAVLRMDHEIDIRERLVDVRCPLLAIHRRDDPYRPADHSRDIAERVPGGVYLEMGGGDHLFWIGPDVELVLAQLRRLFTGVEARPAPERPFAAILFTDITDSTRMATELGDHRWHELLTAHHAVVRRELAHHGGEEIDTAGDGFFAVFATPSQAIRCATAAVEAVRSVGLEIRAGVHAGEVERDEGRVAGITVHTGARVAALAGPGEVLVSRTVVDVVAGSSLEFETRGFHALKGVPGEWEVYAVTGS